MMKRIAFLALCVALLVVVLPGALGRHEGRGESEREEERADRRAGKFELDLGEPREILRTEGGAARVWKENIDAFQNTHVGIAEIELEEDGLVVPQYSDAQKIAYAVEGRGWMGAVFPVQGEFRRTFIRRVEPGDVIALPKGTVYWWYNDGNEKHRVLCAGDTSTGTKPGHVHQFSLAGGRQERFGSVLHGFDPKTLAKAWGVEEKTVESLLERQNEAGIVKVQQKIRFPEPRGEEEYHRRRGMNSEELFGGYRGEQEHCFEELKFSTHRQDPDLFVKDGGWLKIVNGHKLPALKSVGFSAIKVALENNAICAPAFVRNAHQMLFITKGSGRIEIANGEGETVYNKQVQEGSVLVIPQLFPSIKIAGENGLQWINLLTSARPSASFLAGRNSVYKGIPKQVVAAAFNVEEEMLEELRRSRKEEEVIFPGRPSKSRGDDKGIVKEVEDWLLENVLDKHLLA